MSDHFGAAPSRPPSGGSLDGVLVDLDTVCIEAVRDPEGTLGLWVSLVPGDGRSEFTEATGVTHNDGRALAERLARFYGIFPEPDPTAPRYGGVDQPEPGLEQDAHAAPNHGVASVFGDIAAERGAQDARWGGTGHDDRHHDGTGREHLGAGGVDDDRWSFDPDVQTDRTREAFADAAASGTGGWWSDIAAEAVARAFSETDPGRLRRALVVVAAVCVAWIEAIDRRTP